MKMIHAYIQPFMLEKVADALRDMHVRGLTASACRGFGQCSDQGSPHYLDKEVDAHLGFAAKAKIEILCQDAEAEDIVRAIQVNARTGRHGDGKIAVSDICSVTSIRSGETGRHVL